MFNKRKLDEINHELEQHCSKLTSINRAINMRTYTLDQSHIKTIAEELFEALDLIELLIVQVSNRNLVDRYKIFKEDLDSYFSDSMMLTHYGPEILLRAMPKK